ncbi:MAG: FAD:protein FMN transferase [Candidatus Omnitrophica bacterium]|nr:FAD:protein FMN transferase [Candidatus Omnitrophota bacterium]
MRIIWKLSFVFLILCLNAFSQIVKFIEKKEFFLDTIFEIKIEESKNGEEILNLSFELVKNLENKLSIYKEESEVSKLNKYKRYNVSSEVLEVIKKSIYISEITDGAFDITCKPIIFLYKKKFKENQIPTEKEIKEVLKKVGWKNIKIEGNEVILEKEAEIDLGGIAKGYIVDKVSEFLKSKGIKNGLVNGGGDLYCWGTNPEKKKWKIGIEDPFEENKLIGNFMITERGIATSGNYKRYLKIKNQKIGHIVNPKTGVPVEEIPVSVTVIASNCTIADGFATGIFVLGIEKGLDLVNKNKGIECLIIDKDKKIYKSSNFPNFTGNFRFK